MNCRCFLESFIVLHHVHVHLILIMVYMLLTQFSEILNRLSGDSDIIL